MIFHIARPGADNQPDHKAHQRSTEADYGPSHGSLTAGIIAIGAGV
jgi:hypothetical protein